VQLDEKQSGGAEEKDDLLSQIEQLSDDEAAEMFARKLGATRI
jgi:hypothetical protein